LITNLENILINLLGADIIIQKDLQNNIPRIFADPGQVEQVLVNLIVNARDAVNENKNGSVKKIEIITSTIEIKNEQLLQHIDVIPVDHVCIEIRDNGCGMQQEIQQRVYEPFFTTKPEGKGTGLGLSTVYGIVKQNKAIIDLQSQLNKGTSFKIYWPSTDKTEAEHQKDYIQHNSNSGNEIILLVEDEEGIRNFAVGFLEHKGYKVYVAENGKKALKLIEEENIQFDLLISDLNMPDMDGEELVKILNKKIPDLRTIMMSGYGDEFLAKNKLVDGKIEFLQKPFSINNLLFKVRSVLDRN